MWWVDVVVVGESLKAPWVHVKLSLGNLTGVENLTESEWKFVKERGEEKKKNTVRSSLNKSANIL